MIVIYAKRHTLDKRIVELFRRFIEYKCSASELRQVEELIKDGGHNEEWATVLEELAVEHFLSPPGDSSPNTFDQEKLLARIQSSAGITARKRWSATVAWTAAACLLLVGAALLFVVTKNSSRSNIIASTPKAIQKSANHKYLKLADGSKVLLNDSSLLTYPEAFSGNTREVTLTGEAFFDIQHDPKHPFIIHTGELTTTVLGTAFNIKAFKKDHKVTVTVTRGKVRVQKGEQLLAVLTPDQQVIYDIPAARHIQEAVNADKILSWKEYDLIMDDVTLEEAAMRIGKQYGKKVRFVNDKPKDCRFSASFLNRNTLDQVLNVVGQITNTTIALKKDIIEIDGPGCQ